MNSFSIYQYAYLEDMCGFIGRTPVQTKRDEAKFKREKNVIHLDKDGLALRTCIDSDVLSLKMILELSAYLPDALIDDIGQIWNGMCEEIDTTFIGEESGIEITVERVY